MNQSLYSAYSYPNVILAFFGGFIVDKLTGVRLGAAIFCGLIFIGQTIFSVAINEKIYWLAVVGRFVFGLGGESLTVAQNTFTARWFEGKQLAFAFGTVVSFSRIGTSVNFLVTPYFTELGVPFSIWFGTEMCLMSFCACGFVALLDWYGEQAVERRKLRNGTQGDPEVSLRQILYFPLQSWIIFFNCLFFYITVLTFYTIASPYLQYIGGYKPLEASNFLAIPNFVAIFASPMFGYILDKTGRSLLWMGLASIMLILAHLALLAMTYNWFRIPPIAIMVWIGFGYSMYAASIWPTLPFVIKEEMLGTGYGAMTSIQNAGLAAFAQIVATIVGENPQYSTHKQWMGTSLVFVGCGGVSLVLTIFLYIIDKARTNGVLNSSGEVKQEYKNMLNKPPNLVEPVN
jgi:MFS family permease